MDGTGGALAGGATVSEDSVDQEIKEPVLMRESIKLWPFHMEILEGKTKTAGGKCSYDGHAPEGW